VILPGLGQRIRSAVRIWNTRDNRPIGGGFLVDRQHVMTCAHVVGFATGQREQLKRVQTPGELVVELDFVSAPKTQGGKTFRAHTFAEGWYPEEAERFPRDVAVLRLDGSSELPTEASPVVACPETLPGDEFYAYGLKENLPDGTYVQGKFVGQLGPDRVEVVANTLDQAIQEGCSGSGVWNATRFGLSAMIVEMHTSTQGRVIPVEALNEVWPIARAATSVQPTAPGLNTSTVLPLMSRRLSSILYTFDREAQETEFDLALDALWHEHRRPVVCAIAGVDEDRPSLCRDRCLRVRLRERLERHELGGKLPVQKNIQWPRDANVRVADVLLRLKQQVKGELRADDASPVNIRKAYNNGVAPFVFHSLIRESTFDHSHRDLLLQWIAFWQDVGAEPLNKPLAVFLLFQLDGAPDPALALARYFAAEFVRSPPAGARALPLLNDFSRDDVTDWLVQKAEELQLSDSDLAMQLLPNIRTAFSVSETLRLARLENWIDKLQM